MRIVVVNPNTTAAMTAVMRAAAEGAASPGTEILAVEPFIGPDSIEGNFDGLLSAVAVFDRVLAIEDDYDAVVMAGFGEPGREGLQELLEVPVVDVTDAAAHLACLVGRRFSVVTTLDRAVPQIEDRLLLGGMLGRCASVRAAGLGVLELDADPVRAHSRMLEEARAAVTEDGAEVVCLGCGGMAGMAAGIAEALGVPVIDPVEAAVLLAEALCRAGLRTSKARSYQAPRTKSIIGWPLTSDLEPAVTPRR